MKKNKFLSLLGLMLMAAALTTFTACSGSDDDDNNKSGTTYMYDDLDYFQKALCTIDDAGNLVSYNTGTILYKDEPQHLYIGVDNIEEAARIFAKWLSPDVKLPDITPSVRELTAQLTDKQGKPQGTIYFRAGTEPIVAEVTASAGTQLKFIDRITFLLNSAWPQNSGDEDLGINTNLGNDGELGINGDPDNSWGR
jgi:hypothetical protein